MKLVYAPFLALLVAGSVQSETVEQQISKCTSLKSDVARLACYDGIVVAVRTAAAPLPEIKPEVTKNEKWETRITVSPIDNSRSIMLTLVADKGKSSWGTPVKLHIECNQQKTSLFIHWQDFLGNEAKVATRLGNGTPREERWQLSDDSQTTFYPGDTPVFLRQLMAMDTVVFQVTPYFEQSITAVFEMKGLGEAIKPVREACFW